MKRNTTTIISLAILMGAYAFHSRNGFVLYHAFKLVSLLLGGHHS